MMTHTIQLIDEIKERIIAARHVLVVTHKRPDGDALGSLTAVGGMLCQIGNEFTLAVDEGTPYMFQFLPLSHIVQGKPAKYSDYDLIITVDASDEDRLGNIYGSLFELPPVINIDHHPTNTMFGAVNIVPSATPSTCEVLYTLFIDMGIEITAEIATSLLTGVVTDTLAFRTPNVTPDTMAIAGKLMAAGADLPFITMQTLNLMPLTGVEIWRMMLNNLRFEDGFAWASASYEERLEINAGESGSNGLSSLLGNIEEAVMGATMSEVEPGIVRVSLRCRPPYDVSEVAVALGGGGHTQASGCTIHDTLENAEKLLVSLAKEAIQRQDAQFDYQD